MTQTSPNNGSPEEIEAALQSLRNTVGAPPPGPVIDEPPNKLDRRRRRRGGGWSRFLALLILAAAAGAAAMLFLPAVSQRASIQDPTARNRLSALEARIDQLAQQMARGDASKAVADLTQRLTKLDARIATLETRPAPAAGGGVPAERVAALEGQIGAVRTQLAALEAKVGRLAAPVPMPATPGSPSPPQVPDTAAEATAPPGADLAQEMAALDQRLSAIEDSLPAPEVFTALDRRISDLENGMTQASPGASQRNAALALIVARLTQAVGEGRPFALELAALQEASPGLIDAASLQPYAERGLPPVPVLAARLEALGADIRAAADEDRGGDWLDRLWRTLGGLVVVRTEGEAEGNEPEDRLERALWRVRAGDLRAAASEIGALTGRAGEAAAVWLGDARARLAVEDALGAATNQILQDLARTGP